MKKNDYHHLFVLQYLVRLTSDLENHISAMKSNLNIDIYL